MIARGCVLTFVVSLLSVTFSIDSAAQDPPEHETATPASQPSDTPLLSGRPEIFEPGEYDPTELVAQPGAEVGELVVCPVSGQVFRVSETVQHHTHNGERYYVCCQECVAAFEDATEMFLGTE